MPGDPKSALRVPAWLKNYINPSSNNTTGFQRAHMRGDDFFNKLPSDARAAYAELDRFGIGAN